MIHSRKIILLLFLTFILSILAIFSCSSLLWFLFNRFPLSQAFDKWSLFFIIDAVKNDWIYAKLSIFVAIALLGSFVLISFKYFYMRHLKTQAIQKIYNELAQLEREREAQEYNETKTKDYMQKIETQKRTLAKKEKRSELDIIIADLYQKEMDKWQAETHIEHKL